MNYNVNRCVAICQEIHEMLAFAVGKRKPNVVEVADDSEWINLFPMKTHEDLEQIEGMINMDPMKKAQLVSVCYFSSK